MVLQVIACIIIADFLTGFFHWWEDSYGSPTMPIIGQQVIIPNIDHHEHPGVIGNMTTFIYRNYQTVIPATIVTTALFIWLGIETWPIIVTLMLAAFGNETHAWCHKANRNWLIKFLQDTGLIISATQHSKHHRGVYDKYYCTILNVTNACLELIHFWRGLELAIYKISGIKHRRCSPERRGF